MKVVLDTNVLIAAFISHGACHELFEHCAIHHKIYISTFILNEFRSKLKSKFRQRQTLIKQASDLIISRSVITEPVALQTPVCRDSGDDWVLATAVCSNADCLVTGDQDLLEIIQYQNIPIVTPGQFWKLET